MCFSLEICTAAESIFALTFFNLILCLACWLKSAVGSNAMRYYFFRIWCVFGCLNLTYFYLSLTFLGRFCILCSNEGKIPKLVLYAHNFQIFWTDTRDFRTDTRNFWTDTRDFWTDTRDFLTDTRDFWTVPNKPILLKVELCPKIA